MQRTITTVAAAASLALAVSGCSSAGSDTSPDTVSTTRSTIAPPTTGARTTLPVPTTAPAVPTTLPPIVTGPNPVLTSQVRLRADGIGAFHFGDPADQVRAGLIGVLGAPTAPDEVIAEDRFDCDPVPASTVHWGGLQVGFIGAGGDATFTGYDLSGAPVNPGLANSAGITTALTYDQVAALLGTRPPVQPGGGAPVLGAMPADSPRIEIAGGQPSDKVTRMSAGELTVCGLPPPDPSQEEVP